jgi:hypothetical protein
MNPFEYVSVLISIILGLGISQLVTGFADIVHQWERVKLYWPHMLWIGFIFFLHIQDWWTLYDLRNLSSWRLHTFLFTFLYPINLFILARLLFPFGSVGKDTDFKVFYFQNFRRIFVWAIISVGLSITDNLLLSNLSLTEQPLQLSLFGFLSFITIKNYQQEWIHKFIVILLTTLLVISLISHEWTISS